MAYEFKKLGEVEALEEVPDGANALIEVNGDIKRVPGSNLGGGGGIPTAILRLNTGDSDSNTETASERAAQIVYTYTCDNMTFDEAKAILSAGNPLNAVLLITETSDDATGYSNFQSTQVTFVDYGEGVNSMIGLLFIEDSDVLTLYWTEDNEISTQMPK